MEISRFPNKLRVYRRINGYSQKKVARLLGLADTGTLSRREHGYVLPGILQVFRLARLYHVAPHHLFDDLWHELHADPGLLAPAEEPGTTHQHYAS